MSEKTSHTQTVEKYLQNTYLVKDLYTQFLKNYYNSVLRRQAKGQKYEHFKKENTQIISKHMKRCSTSLAIRKTQFKSTVK